MTEEEGEVRRGRREEGPEGRTTKATVQIESPIPPEKGADPDQSPASVPSDTKVERQTKRTHLRLAIPRKSANLPREREKRLHLESRDVYLLFVFHLTSEIKTTAQNAAPKTDHVPPPEDQTTDNGPLSRGPQIARGLLSVDPPTVLALQSDGLQTDHGHRHGDLLHATVGTIVVK